MKKLSYFSFILFFSFVCSCSQKNKNDASTVIPAENVINIATVKKSKAEITGMLMLLMRK